MTYFSGSKFFGCFEKHPKVVSGALRDGFRAREVFGSFEKRTPGLKPEPLTPACSHPAPIDATIIDQTNAQAVVSKFVT